MENTNSGINQFNGIECKFIRRFPLHISPKGFTRIRDYGILSSNWKKEKLPKLQGELATVKMEPIKAKEPLLHRRCPICKKGRLHTILLFNDRGPPENWQVLLKERKLNRSHKKYSAKCGLALLCLHFKIER